MAVHGKPNGHVRMSFVFPSVFYKMLSGMSDKYDRDMTYIIMEAVNAWVMQKEEIGKEELLE